MSHHGKNLQNGAVLAVLSITHKPAAQCADMRAEDAMTRKFPVLLADIGGTNARFSMLEAPDAELVHFPDVRTADFSSVEEAVSSSVFTRSAIRPASAVLAVAGPIRGNEIPLTNCSWTIRPIDVLKSLGMSDLLVINDFEAQALACSNVEPDDIDRIGPAIEPSLQTRLVLGPGTGLGVAGLVYARGKWIPVPGEGGHVDLGPRTPFEREVFHHLHTIEGRISGEQILCGRGIVNLYQAICKVHSVEASLPGPADISAEALAGSNKQAVETVSLFSTCLGRLAGDLAMVFLARGGVFLAGGITQKVLPLLKQSPFREAFEDKAPHSAMLKDIPTLVLTHPRAALVGLERYVRQPELVILAEAGRRWN